MSIDLQSFVFVYISHFATFDTFCRKKIWFNGTLLLKIEPPLNYFDLILKEMQIIQICNVNTKSNNHSVNKKLTIYVFTKSKGK